MSKSTQSQPRILSYNVLRNKATTDNCPGVETAILEPPNAVLWIVQVDAVHHCAQNPSGSKACTDEVYCRSPHADTSTAKQYDLHQGGTLKKFARILPMPDNRRPDTRFNIVFNILCRIYGIVGHSPRYA